MISDTAGWLRLKSRIERRVTLEQTSVALGGHSLDWYRVSDAEQLLQTAAIAESGAAEELDPFWAATWRAAVGLDRFLSRIDLQGVRVLELGCGSGQAGVGAAYRGANATLTDAVGLALLVARLNAWPIRHRIRLQRLKWDHGCLPRTDYPIILGSDVVYDTRLFPLLDACARRHLAVGGRMFLSEPHRHTGDIFADWIRHAGWKSLHHEIDLDDQRVGIRVFECHL